MIDGMKNRLFAYYSGVFNMVYELYKLKSDSVYAKQRYSSWNNLVEYGIEPAACDYELCDGGMLENSYALNNAIEQLIQEKNTCKNNTVSVGDIINVFHLGCQSIFFVDAVGLRKLNSFFELEYAIKIEHGNWRKV